MKLTMVGANHIGATAVSQLLHEELCDVIALVDPSPVLAEGRRLDLLLAGSAAQRCLLTAGDYTQATASDIIVIVTGSTREAGEPVLEHAQREARLMAEVLTSMLKEHDDPLLVVAGDPVDVLTYQAARTAGVSPDRVIGVGTLSETLRLRAMLAERLHLSAAQVAVQVLGGPGDQMVPVLSSATIAGIPLADLPGYSQQLVDEVVEATRYGALRIAERTGGMVFSRIAAIVEIVRAVTRDTREILPVSTLQDGELGMHNVCLSMPTVVGRRGRRAMIPPSMSESERDALTQSYNQTRQLIADTGI